MCVTRTQKESNISEEARVCGCVVESPVVVVMPAAVNNKQKHCSIAEETVEKKDVVGVSVHDWHIRIERTTIHGFRALFSSGFVICVTTRRVATHCARGSRFARCHSTLCGTSAWLGLYPIA